jgi:hypothetical protein
MKRNWIETGRNLLIILINHLVLIAFGMTVMGLFNQNQNMIWLWSLMVAVPLVFYWARVKVGNFFLFFILHLMAPVGMFFMPVSILEKLILIFICMVYFIWSIKIRLNESRNKGEDVLPPIFMAIALFVMTIIENTHSQKGWESIYLVLAVIFAAGYCIHMYTNQYLRFLAVNESSAANIPEVEIFTHGFKQSMMFMIGCVILLVFTANIGWLSYLMSFVGNALFEFLKFIFANAGRTEAEMPIIYEQIQQAAPDMGMLGDPGEPALIWKILEKILMYGGVLAIIGLIFYGIAMAFKNIWKQFHKNVEKDEKAIHTGIDVRESCAIEKVQKEGNSWFSFLNNREKVRKAYRKQVLKNKSTIIGNLNTEDLEYMTAKECCDKFSAEQLKKAYEKARYSAEEITSDDVKMAKSAVR